MADAARPLHRMIGVSILRNPARSRPRSRTSALLCPPP